MQPNRPRPPYPQPMPGHPGQLPRVQPGPPMPREGLPQAVGTFGPGPIPAGLPVPQQQPPPPPEEPPQREEDLSIQIVSSDPGETLARTRVTPAFQRFVDAYWARPCYGKSKLSPEVRVAIAMAVNLRMRYATQQCVVWAKRRCGEAVNAETPRTCVDVPMARFAQLKAEQQILDSKAKVSLSDAPDKLPPELDRLRTDAVAGIAAQVPANERDEILQSLHEHEGESEGAGDCECLLDLVPKTEKRRAVTVQDVGAFVQSDSAAAGIQRLALHVRKLSQKAKM